MLGSAAGWWRWRKKRQTTRLHSDRIDDQHRGARLLPETGLRCRGELGTTPDALILARSEAHQSHHVVVPEELLTHVTTVTGERPLALIRADIVYFETMAGGAVFSVGSITFCGSLSHNTYQNNISRILENVLRRFLTE